MWSDMHEESSLSQESFEISVSSWGKWKSKVQSELRRPRSTPFIWQVPVQPGSMHELSCHASNLVSLIMLYINVTILVVWTASTRVDAIALEQASFTEDASWWDTSWGTAALPSCFARWLKKGKGFPDYCQLVQGASFCFEIPHMSSKILNVQLYFHWDPLPFTKKENGFITELITWCHNHLQEQCVI